MFSLKFDRLSIFSVERKIGSGKQESYKIKIDLIVCSHLRSYVFQSARQHDKVKKYVLKIANFRGTVVIVTFTNLKRKKMLKKKNGKENDKCHNNNHTVTSEVEVK